jgi:nitrate/TMAO reductase-like tetraheme cytochrome c subunit
MRHEKQARRLQWLWTVGLVAFCLTGVAAAQDAKPPDTYVWAEACKTCHPAHYTAWQKTKHANALTRLSGSERQPGACIGCHVTGAAELAPANVNGNVQCEACHGPGRAHVQAATGGAAKPGAITKTPNEATCVRCHSDKSPHFKFFSYPALAPLVHQLGR